MLQSYLVFVNDSVMVLSYEYVKVMCTPNYNTSAP